MDDDVAAVRTHFDAFAGGEWERLDRSPRDRAAFELHRRLLARFVRPGWRVLEIGAGPGRFTLELAALGATVLVSDVSPVQLGLNRERVAATAHESAVEDRRILDIRDLSDFPAGAFDAVVAYGGPLSYTFEQAGPAFAECLRVTRPGGVLLASVMSTAGSARCFLPGIAEEIATLGVAVIGAVLRTGDIREMRPPAGAHICRMFRWREVAELIAAQPCRLLAASASNALTAGDAAAVDRLAADPAVWARVLDWEEELAAEPGMLDAGTHILFAVERA
jgi:SAM-dependent methyltransferase